MCGRIKLLTYNELQEVLDAVKAGRSTRLAQVEARAQARPGSSVQALAPEGKDVLIMPLTWGFTLPNTSKIVFNTRIESALGSTRLWVDAIRDGRCVLPVATFFEPHESETIANPRTGRSMKRQYEFSSPDGKPLLLASVQQNGCLSVVTTAPNADVMPIHPRMPLVLRFDEVATWLYGDYPSLNNRLQIKLATHPEGIESTPSSQLSLF